MTSALTPGILWQSAGFAFSAGAFLNTVSGTKFVGASDFNELAVGTSPFLGTNSGREFVFVDPNGLVYVVNNSASTKALDVYDLDALTASTTGTVLPTNTISLGSIGQVDYVRRAHTDHLLVKENPNHFFVNVNTGAQTPIPITTAANFFYHGGFLYNTSSSALLRIDPSNNATEASINTLPPPNPTAASYATRRPYIAAQDDEHMYVVVALEEVGVPSFAGLDVARAIRIYKINVVNFMNIVGFYDIYGTDLQVAGVTVLPDSRVVIAVTELNTGIPDIRGGYVTLLSAGMNLASTYDFSPGDFPIDVDASAGYEVLVTVGEVSVNRGRLESMRVVGGLIVPAAVRITNESLTDSTIAIRRETFDNIAPVITPPTSVVSLDANTSAFATVDVNTADLVTTGLRFRRNGMIQRGQGTSTGGVGGISYTDWRSWASPATFDIGDSYYIRYTPVDNSPIAQGNMGDNAGSFIQINTDREVIIITSATSLGLSQSTGTLDIATDAAGNNIVATTNVILTLEVF